MHRGEADGFVGGNDTLKAKWAISGKIQTGACWLSSIMRLWEDISFLEKSPSIFILVTLWIILSEENKARKNYIITSCHIPTITELINIGYGRWLNNLCALNITACAF